jgi:hypothetical protein
MNWWRLFVVGLTAAVLAGLFGWQVHRERLVRACLDDGGVWDGPRSLCRAPVRPILQRDYRRSGASHEHVARAAPRSITDQHWSRPCMTRQTEGERSCGHRG